MVSLTVMGRPFHSLVFFWMSSPIFLGERPRGPSLGARAAVFPTSPPIARRITYCASPGTHRGRTQYTTLDGVQRGHGKTKTQRIPSKDACGNLRSSARLQPTCAFVAQRVGGNLTTSQCIREIVCRVCGQPSIRCRGPSSLVDEGSRCLVGRAGPTNVPGAVRRAQVRVGSGCQVQMCVQGSALTRVAPSHPKRGPKRDPLPVATVFNERPSSTPLTLASAVSTNSCTAHISPCVLNN